MTTGIERYLLHATVGAIVLWGSVVGSRSPALANEVDGFTEPYKTVEVAAVETGTIKSIDVKEGDLVNEGQVLAQLDDDVYQALLAIAEQAMRGQSALKSAEAELAMRRQRLEKLVALREQGHARQEEVERARTDVEMAEARVLSANEQTELKRLEYDKVKVQLARRSVRSPIDGVVSLLHKDEGEFVAPNDPHVLEVVQLDPLLATFSVPDFLASQIHKEEKLPVFLEEAGAWVDGKVELIAPLTDAESGTVRVKVRIPNPGNKYRSGERCTIQLKSPASTARPRPRP
jgi:RND family efflux transporter MFP subunit